ncbi:MAG: ATP-binding protein [Acidobacteriota bacterium]|nr:ATP-binding protein [Acidobacteriota bacterium]
MEKIARPFRVCLTGAESTGKTELAKELAGHFSATLVPEYSREYALSKHNVLSYSDVGPIAHGQMEREDRALAGGRDLVILDTDLLSTLVYSRHHFGAVPQWVQTQAQERLADFYLLLDIDVPWVWDPVRDSGPTREELHADFRSALEELGARYELISGKWDERRRRSIELIEAKLVP